MLVALIICLSFLLTSTGWLSWLYRLIELGDPAQADFLTVVCGYLVQAVGMGISFALIPRGRTERRAALFALALILYLPLLALSTLANSCALIIAAGLLANIPCGIVQGMYLCLLAELVPPQNQGTVFGLGYAGSTVLTWLLSLPARGALTRGVPCALCIAVMVCATAWLVRLATTSAPRDNADLKSPEGGPLPPALLAVSCATALLVSCVKTAGFSFPTADLGAGVNLEFSRLFYGIGLVVAGLASDRDRRYGLFFCVAALVAPFLMLSLSGAGASGALLWMTGYFLTGFYAVFRVLLAVDLARMSGRSELAVLGLLFGRVGEALGSLLSLTLTPSPMALIATTALLFVLTAACFARLSCMLFMVGEEKSSPVLVTQTVSASASVAAAQAVPASAMGNATAMAPVLATGSAPALATGSAPTKGTAPATGIATAMEPAPAPAMEPAPAPATEPAPAPASAPAPVQPSSERDRFEVFAARYGLTSREREVLRLVLDERSNSEIASELFVSEGTVKYHVGNLLKKTGCKNRLEILAFYACV